MDVLRKNHRGNEKIKRALAEVWDKRNNKFNLSSISPSAAPSSHTTMVKARLQSDQSVNITSPHAAHPSISDLPCAFLRFEIDVGVGARRGGGEKGG